MTDSTTTDDTTEEQGYAEGWRPKRGDRVVGTVIDIAATDGGYGVYPIVTLKTATGEVAIHAFHTVLRRELARRKPKTGDDLDITYLGKQKGGQSDNGYDGYRVRSSKDTVGYDWDRELTDEERESVPREPDVPIEPARVPVAASEQEMSPENDDDVPF